MPYLGLLIMLLWCERLGGNLVRRHEPAWRPQQSRRRASQRRPVPEQDRNHRLPAQPLRLSAGIGLPPFVASQPISVGSGRHGERQLNEAVHSGVCGRAARLPGRKQIRAIRLRGMESAVTHVKECVDCLSVKVAERVSIGQ